MALSKRPYEARLEREDARKQAEIDWQRKKTKAIMEKQRSIESWLLAKRRARLNGGGSVKVPDILRKRELTMEEKAKLRAPELFRAVKSGNTARVTKMIAIDRVDVNVKDVNGWGPLHHACIRGYSGIAQLLLGSGAMIEPLTNDRRTPLELAKIAGHGGTMTVLRKALSMQCLVAPLSAGEKELVLQKHTCQQQQQLSVSRDDCLYLGNRGRNKVAAKITDTIFAGRHPGTYASVPALRFIWSRPIITLCGFQF